MNRSRGNTNNLNALTHVKSGWRRETRSAMHFGNCRRGALDVSSGFARRRRDIARERGLHDGAVLAVDVATGRADGHCHPPVALALLVERIAEAHQPVEAAG